MRTAIRLLACVVLAATAAIALAEWPYGTELPQVVEEPAKVEELGGGSGEPWYIEREADMTRRVAEGEREAVKEHYRNVFVEEAWAPTP